MDLGGEGLRVEWDLLELYDTGVTLEGVGRFVDTDGGLAVEETDGRIVMPLQDAGIHIHFYNHCSESSFWKRELVF